MFWTSDGKPLFTFEDLIIHLFSLLISNIQNKLNKNLIESLEKNKKLNLDEPVIYVTSFRPKNV